MVIKTVCNQPFKDSYIQEYLKKGQKQIQKYSMLYSILGDFDMFIPEKYDHNILLNFLSWSYEDDEILDTDSIIKSGSGSLIEKMRKINKIIEKRYHLNILNEIELLFKNDINLSLLKKNKREDIKAKMKSFDKDNNQGLFQELHFFMQLKRNSMISDIIYENIPESNHDFRFTFKETEFNMEVTSLGVTEIEKIISNSFKIVGEKFVDDIPKTSNIRLDVNIERLRSKTNRFEEEYIIKLLSVTIQNLLPILTLSETHGSFSKKFFENDSSSLLQFCKYYMREEASTYNLPIVKALNKLSKTKRGKSYLRETKTKDIFDTPIVSFLNSRAEKGVKCITFSLLVVEEKRIKAKLKQIKNRLEEKLEFNQLANQKNPILVIQFADVFFHKYSDSNLSNSEFLNRITPIVNQCFEDLKVPTNIFGVIIYEEDLDKGIFIENPKISIEKRTKSIIGQITRIVL